MSLSIGYLTPKQLQIWDYKRTGLQEASIARELQVSRQTVHKAIGIAHAIIGESLGGAARMDMIEIRAVVTRWGLRLG